MDLTQQVKNSLATEQINREALMHSKIQFKEPVVDETIKGAPVTPLHKGASLASRSGTSWRQGLRQLANGTATRQSTSSAAHRSCGACSHATSHGEGPVNGTGLTDASFKPGATFRTVKLDLDEHRDNLQELSNGNAAVPYWRTLLVVKHEGDRGPLQEEQQTRKHPGYIRNEFGGFFTS